jgi:hypothetical protein
MKTPRLTRKQIREQIANTPIEEILHVPSRSLTTKQKTYCKKVAEGKPYNQAYREAYNSKGKPKSIGKEVNVMNKSPRIAHEIEAQKRAIEFETAYSARQLKSIVISQLTLEALNPASKASERISALKALGNVAELGVFVERKEVRTIRDSTSAKADLLQKLQQAIKDQKRTVDTDAMSLLEEISSNSFDASQQEKDFAAEALAANPPLGDPPNERSDERHILHSIPLKQSPIENDSQQTPPKKSEKSMKSKTSVSSNRLRIEKEGGGGSKNGENDTMSHLETPPLIDSVEKG